MSALLPCFSQLSRAKTPSWSMAVPIDGSLKSMTLRSAGVKSAPVFGLVVSRTWAYSL